MVAGGVGVGVFAQAGTVLVAGSLHRSGQVLEQRPAVGHLPGVRSRLLDRTAVAAVPVAAHGLGSGACLQPGREGLAGAVWQDADHCGGLHADQDGPIGPGPPERSRRCRGRVGPGPAPAVRAAGQVVARGRPALRRCRTGGRPGGLPLPVRPPATMPPPPDPRGPTSWSGPRPARRTCVGGSRWSRGRSAVLSTGSPFRGHRSDTRRAVVRSGCARDGTAPSSLDRPSLLRRSGLGLRPAQPSLRRRPVPVRPPEAVRAS